MVPELIPVLGSQPAGDVSHKPGGRLPLLSARPAVTPATLKRATTNFAAWWTEARWVWTVCLILLPDSVAAAIWTQAHCAWVQHANHSATWLTSYNYRLLTVLAVFRVLSTVQLSKTSEMAQHHHSQPCLQTLPIADLFFVMSTAGLCRAIPTDSW